MSTEKLKWFIIQLVIALVAVALILIADATRPMKKDDIRLNERGECVYPMSLSFALGLVQLVFVLAVVSHYTCQNGCCCTRRDGVSGSNLVLGIFLAVISWSLALDAAGYCLMDVVAIWPGRRGKAPECYKYLEADHNRLMKNAFNRGIFAIIFGACSSKLLSPPLVAS